MAQRKLNSLAVLALTISLLVGLIFFAEATSVPLKILSLTPAPNYPRCGNDRASLTDGKTAAYPIWVRPGCVGWTEPGLVKIVLQGGDGSRSPLSGKLRFHTARGTSADVHLPARIDVYTQRDDCQYGHAAGITIPDHDFADQRNHWIALEVTSVRFPLLAILRPQGNYLFIDEIRWEPQPPAPPPAQPVVGDEAACTQDSTERYRQSLLARVTLPEETARGWSQAFQKEPQVVWVVDNPYAALPLYPPARLLGQAPREIHLTGTKSERESACIGILNLKNAEQVFQISLEGDPQVVSGVELSRVGKILTADGALVFDPLVPLDKSGNFKTPSREAAYLWVQADLRRLSPGQHCLRIMVRDRNHRVIQAIPLTLHVLDLALPPDLRPRAITWGYSTDLPLWLDPPKMVADLVDHGINVFVVPPARIPMPTLTGDWQSSTAAKLASDVSLYRGKGLILLYLGWGPGQGPAWLNPLANQDIPRQQAALQTWLIKLGSFLKGLGLSHRDWALYPVDEPHGPRLPYLGALAKWVKAAAPDIQIYANPITTATHKTTSADLVKLSPYIDFWQPGLGCATGPAARFFAHLPRPWWTYAGGPSPAKSASPWNDYRLLSWRSWAASAKGVGFWSYSDTSGTTAWDDFDGRRPDFAVVYEGQDGPISSRRWEAFRKGIEDFQLMEAVAQGQERAPTGSALKLKSRVQALLRQSPVPWAGVTALRREMLNACQPASTARP
jgi:hypothetical protein